MAKSRRKRPEHLYWLFTPTYAAHAANFRPEISLAERRHRGSFECRLAKREMPVKGKLPSRVKTPTREREKMAKKITEYRDISKFTEGYVIVETFIASGERSSSNVRVRPIPSEGFDPDIRVQCSNKMRMDVIAHLGSTVRLHGRYLSPA